MTMGAETVVVAGDVGLASATDTGAQTTAPPHHVDGSHYDDLARYFTLPGLIHLMRISISHRYGAAT